MVTPDAPQLAEAGPAADDFYLSPDVWQTGYAWCRQEGETGCGSWGESYSYPYDPYGPAQAGVFTPDAPQLAGAEAGTVAIDPAADDFVWQKGYAWCLTTTEAASGCAVYNSQAGGELPELAVLPPGARCCRVDEGWEKMKNYKLSGGGATRETPSKANPGHLLLCGNALLFGAAMATGDVLCGRGSEYISYVCVYS